MDIYKHLPVLLKAESEGDQIKLRLDENGLGNFDLSGKSIQVIILFGCEEREELVNRFQDLINKVLEYEFFEQNDKTIFRFWGDYGRIEDEIECQKFTAALSEYTKIDLAQK